MKSDIYHCQLSDIDGKCHNDIHGNETTQDIIIVDTGVSISFHQVV